MLERVHAAGEEIVRGLARCGRGAVAASTASASRSATSWAACSRRTISTRRRVCARRSTPTGPANPGKVLPAGSRAASWQRVPDGAVGVRALAALTCAEVGRRSTPDGRRRRWAHAVGRRRRGRRVGPRRARARRHREHEPAEMTVRGAGRARRVAELDAALGEHGQCVALPERRGGTVGGVLARRAQRHPPLGYGPVRDARAAGPLRVAPTARSSRRGGPTVKNVSGYDLRRLLVGSLGTLGIIGEVDPAHPARCPRRAVVRRSTTDPFALARRAPPARLDAVGRHHDLGAARRPSGRRRRARVASPGWTRPTVRRRRCPRGHTLVVAAAAARRPAVRRHGRFVAEVGVGVVHRDVAPPRREVDPVLAGLHTRIKDTFDPTGRLAPGRTVLA